jgi:hypothetical protein
VTLARMGELDAAADALATALAKYPDSLTLLNNLGYVELARGRPDAAHGRLRRALELDPSNAMARSNWQRLTERAALEPGLAQALQALPPQAPEPAPPPRAAVSTSVLNLPPLSVAPPADLAQRPSIGLRQDARYRAPTPPAMPTRPVSVETVPVSSGIVPVASPVAGQMAASAAPVRTASAQDTGRQVARIEVSNGNGVRLMASRVAQGLMSRGMRVTRITNAPRFDVARTRIDVRDGHMEQAIALARLLGVQPEMRRVEDLPGQMDLRFVLGRDAESATTVARITGDIAALAAQASATAR